MEYDSRKKNPEGVDMQLAQDEAKPGPPIRASFARIGVGSGVLGKVGKRSESPGDGTVLMYSPKFPLAFQHELERVAQVCLRFLQGFSLRYCPRNLLHEAGVTAFSGWLKYCRKLHALSVSQEAVYAVGVRTVQQLHGW